MIGILGFNDLHLMQYLYKYTNILDNAGVPYEVIFWDRSSRKEPVGFAGNAVSFEYPLNTYLPFHRKIVGFLRYAHFMRKKIKERKYERLIILTTQTAIPLFDLLISKYSENYIYDYRDITKEKFLPFKKMVQALIKYSYKTAISSEGFLPVIGLKEKGKIIVAHNTQHICKSSKYAVSIPKKEPIRIVYWGMVRQIEFNKKVCDIWGTDERFSLIYHGDGYYQELNDYCIEKGYKNIFFTGKYATSTITNFIKETDILNCLYENDDIQQRAMPVKAYDAIHYRLPVLVTSASYVANYFNGTAGVLAISIDSSSNIAEKVYNWYSSLNEELIESAYREKEKMIYKNDIEFANILRQFYSFDEMEG